MAKDFFTRLREYYLKVAEVLRGEADSASVFPNPTDIGEARERIYADFLRQHAPSKCNVFLGGFLFDDNGIESKQLDVIVSTDTAPRFDFHNRDGSGKSFSPVEGTLGVASIKSNLDKNQLFDALGGIASIPPTKNLEGRVNLLLKISNYDDWPYKIVYSSKGLEGQTLLEHVQTYYNDHPEIPVNRRPHLIHVAGSYVILRIKEGMTVHNKSGVQEQTPEIGTFFLMTRDPDLQAIVWALDSLQQNAMISNHIQFSYGDLINKVNLLT